MVYWRKQAEIIGSILISIGYTSKSLTQLLEKTQRYIVADLGRKSEAGTEHSCLIPLEAPEVFNADLKKTNQDKKIFSGI